MTRINVLAGLIILAGALCPAPLTAGEPVELIAHRGGVVGSEFAENSPEALRAAIERGYWMVEVDIRESKDGRLVVQHDPDFHRFYGNDGRVAEMTWDQIRRLRARPGGTRPLLFSELAALAQGRMRLMLDTKPPQHSAAFFQSMEEALRNNRLLTGAYIIGTEQARAYFTGKARVGLSRRRLREAVARGEDVTKRYFLFEHGRDLDAETVQWARQLGVPVVPSVNINHYAGAGNHREEAKRDIVRLLDLGVTEFQIDSIYDEWLRK